MKVRVRYSVEMEGEVEVIELGGRNTLQDLLEDVAREVEFGLKVAATNVPNTRKLLSVSFSPEDLK